MASDFIASEFADGVGLRWQSHAILALQEAAEAFLVHLFEDAYYIISFDFKLSNSNFLFVVIFVQFMPSE